MFLSNKFAFGGFSLVGTIVLLSYWRDFIETRERKCTSSTCHDCFDLCKSVFCH